MKTNLIQGELQYSYTEHHTIEMRSHGGVIKLCRSFGLISLGSGHYFKNQYNEGMITIIITITTSPSTLPWPLAELSPEGPVFLLGVAPV